MVALQQLKTGLVADNFFLMVNYDPLSRPRLSERIFALGLAGALLAELLLYDGVVGIDKGNLVRTGSRHPSDRLHAELCRAVEAETLPLPLRDWLDYLSIQAIDRVGQRLQARGVVQLKQSWLKVAGRANRWVPAGTQLVNWPALDVARKIYNGQAEASVLMLFGLTHATGLDNPDLWPIRHLLTDPALLEQTLSPLVKFEPALVELLAQTEVAVGSAVTSQRRS